MTWNLAIPNLEVFTVYKKFVNQVSFQSNDSEIRSLMNCFLKEGELKDLAYRLQKIVRNLLSYHDTAKEPEVVYHAFILGLLANLRNVYEIRSNPETGYGRADILMRPKTEAYPLAFVIEFKSISKNGNMKKAAAEALTQIEEKAYTAQLIESGIPPEEHPKTHHHHLRQNSKRHTILMRVGTISVAVSLLKDLPWIVVGIMKKRMKIRFE